VNKPFATRGVIIWALFVTRTKEFYRDRGALLWSLLLPICIVTAIAIAFSGKGQELFRVGVYLPAPEAVAIEAQQPLLAKPYVQRIDYDNLGQALERVRHHQLDLLLAADQPGKYWINETSVKGKAVEALLLGQLAADDVGHWSRQLVSGRQVRYVDWVIPGVLGMNVMFGALFGIGFVIVRYRKNGVLKRLQVTPVTPLEFLTAQVLSRLLVMMVTATLVYIGCDLFLNFVMLGSYLTLLLVAALGIFAMITLALIIASRTASEELANGLLNFAAFPMLLLSEVWFSLDNAPAWLKVVSQCFPLTHMVQAARDIMIEGAGLVDVTYHLLVMALMSVVFLVIAAYLFRWNER
jgi:ABC-type multidrug transport system permease subunit